MTLNAKGPRPANEDGPPPQYICVNVFPNIESRNDPSRLVRDNEVSRVKARLEQLVQRDPRLQGVTVGGGFLVVEAASWPRDE